MTEQQINDLINSNLPDNTVAFITPQKLREVILAITDTLFDNVMVAPATLPVPGSAVFALLAGRMLEFIVVQPTGAGNIRVGTTAGGAELIDDDPGGNPLLIRLDYFAHASTTIYFTGNATVTIYTR